MNREEALSLLNAKLDEYCKLSHDQLAARIGDEEFPEVVGATGTQYQIETQIVWDDKPGGDVRVLAAIDDGGCAVSRLPTQARMGQRGNGRKLVQQR